MSLPSAMTAIAIRAPGGPEMLVPQERPMPSPGDGEILVKVAAAGVNRPDVMQRQGHYPPPPGATDIPGLEIAGEVVALGAGRQTLEDRRPRLRARGRAAATRNIAWRMRRNALPIPAGLSMVEAAAIPETFFTVWHNALRARRAQEPARRCSCMAAAPASARPRSSSPRHSAHASSPPPARRRNARPAASSAPTSPSTTRPRTSSPRPRQRPAARARRHARHGRRRLYRAQLRGRRRRGPHRADRLPGQPEGDGRLHAASCSSA